MTPFENASDFERGVMILLRQEGWITALPPKNTKGYDIELSQNAMRVAVQVKNYKAKVHLGHVQKFLKFLERPDAQDFDCGFFISASGFTESVYSHLRSEGINNLRLGVYQDGKIFWDNEKIFVPPKREKVTFIGVFTCKGGVGKTTVAAHLAGAFAVNGYDVVLLDLDPQSNLRRLLDGGVYFDRTRNKEGSLITVWSLDEWDEDALENAKIVVCDCNPEFTSNPVDFIRKFDYCIVPTTLNPLGINKNAQVIQRTFEQIRGENKKAELFVLINNYHPDEAKRNEVLSRILRKELKRLTENDKNCHLIDPEDAAVRFSKQLLYWGYHIVENAEPQLAFNSVGGRSHPREDFLKLVDYLENCTEIENLKA